MDDPEAGPSRGPVTGVVLAGGESRRFGSSKAAARFLGQTLLQRVIAALQTHCAEIVVVGGVDRPLPDAMAQVPLRLVADRVPQAGPLAGIAAGLEAASHNRVLLSPVDVPCWSPGLMGWMLDNLWDTDQALVAVVGGRLQPLQAVLRRGPALLAAGDLLAGGERRASQLIEALRSRYIEEPELRVHDPGLLSFRSANTPAELAEIEGLLARG